MEPSNGTETVSPSAAGSAQVHTYHCLCTNIVLATTTPLADVPQRSSSSSLDKAHVLPLPPPPSAASDEQSSAHYAMLLSTLLERKPQVVTGENGFEKRWLQRCGRCRLVVGYQLDWSQYENVQQPAVSDDEDLQQRKKMGRRDDVVYLLPGGLLSTADMAAGKEKALGEGT